MPRITVHGGSCCGVRHIAGFSRQSAAAHYRDLKDLIGGNDVDSNAVNVRGNSNRLAEVIVTNDQLDTALASALRACNFRLVSRFRNSNSGNICNVFHYVPTPEPLDGLLAGGVAYDHHAPFREPEAPAARPAAPAVGAIVDWNRPLVYVNGGMSARYVPERSHRDYRIIQRSDGIRAIYNDDGTHRGNMYSAVRNETVAVPVADFTIDDVIANPSAFMIEGARDPQCNGVIERLNERAVGHYCTVINGRQQLFIRRGEFPNIPHARGRVVRNPAYVEPAAPEAAAPIARPVAPPVADAPLVLTPDIDVTTLEMRTPGNINGEWQPVTSVHHGYPFLINNFWYANADGTHPNINRGVPFVRLRQPAAEGPTVVSSVFRNRYRNGLGRGTYNTEAEARRAGTAATVQAVVRIDTMSDGETVTVEIGE